MTELEPLRHLRFERLESRSLLAGGILDSPIDIDLFPQTTPTSAASDQNRAPSDVATRVPASSEPRGPQARPQENRQQENIAQHLGRRENDFSGNGFNRSQQNANQLSQSIQTNQAQPTPPTTSNDFTPLAAPATVSAALVGSSITSNENPPSQTNRTPLATRAVGQVLASLQSDVDDADGSENRDDVILETTVTNSVTYRLTLRIPMTLWPRRLSHR